METQDFYIEPATWPTDREDIEPVRLEVFVAEQKVPEEEEFDADEPTSQHFLARESESGEIIGTARLTRDGRIGRMAVKQAWRGRGVGAALLRSCLEAAKLRGMTEVRAASQTYAQEFYAKLGFEPEGAVFDEVGIPHRWMRLHLRDRDFVGPAERERRKPASSDELPEGPFRLPSEFAERMVALVRCCREQLDVYTHDLDPTVLNRTDIFEALRELVAFAKDPQVRILVIDSRKAVQDGHRWINLAQQRPTAVQLRNPDKQHADNVSAFAIADRRHVVYRDFGDRWEGRAHANDVLQARQLGDFFDDAWEHASPDPKTRRLDL